MPGYEGTGLNVIANFRDFFSDFHTPEKDNFYMIKRKYEKKTFERACLDLRVSGSWEQTGLQGQELFHRPGFWAFPADLGVLLQGLASFQPSFCLGREPGFSVVPL